MAPLYQFLSLEYRTLRVCIHGMTVTSLCQTPSKERTDTSTDKRTNRQKGRHQKSNLVHFSLRMQYFNGFPENHLTKFRVFIGLSRIFTPPLHFYQAPRSVPRIGRTPLTYTTDKRTRQFVCSSVR